MYRCRQNRCIRKLIPLRNQCQLRNFAAVTTAQETLPPLPVSGIMQPFWGLQPPTTSFLQSSETMLLKTDVTNFVKLNIAPIDLGHAKGKIACWLNWTIAWNGGKSMPLQGWIAWITVTRCLEKLVEKVFKAPIVVSPEPSETFGANVYLSSHTLVKF